MILRSLLAILTLSVATSPALAAPRELTVFSDGSLVELEGVARKGIVELALPGQVREGTLRVKPLDNGSVGRVELLPFRLPERQQKELDSLTEQKNRLEDRMKALDQREGIFAAAAKSQSSKAPRKSKTNPDPLASVRQGPDFAIAQLEAVFTARRRTEQELKRVETRIAGLQKNAAGGPTVRVSVAPATARVRLAAVLNDSGWRPRYEIRLQGDGTARVAMLAGLVQPLPDGFVTRIVPAALAAGVPQQSFPLSPNAAARLAEWRLPVEKESIASGPLPGFSFTLKNTGTVPLPAGEAAIYGHEEYLGTVSLPGLAQGAAAGIAHRPR